MAHVRQSKQGSDLGFQAKVVKTCEVVPSSRKDCHQAFHPLGNYSEVDGSTKGALVNACTLWGQGLTLCPHPLQSFRAYPCPTGSEGGARFRCESVGLVCV